MDQKANRLSIEWRNDGKVWIGYWLETAPGVWGEMDRTYLDGTLDTVIINLCETDRLSHVFERKQTETEIKRYHEMWEEVRDGYQLP